MNCRLCGGEGRVLYENLRDRLCGTPGTWTLKQCPAADCGLVWLDPLPTAAELRAAYQNYFTHEIETGAPSFARRLYRRLLRLTPVGRERQRLAWMYLDRTPPGRLLEIGCGNGARLAQFRDRGWTVTGIEPDPTAAAIARDRFGLPVSAGPIAGTDYDAVIMNHVLEHAPDPLALLADCHRALRPGGRLTVVTPNLRSLGHRWFGACWRGLEPPRHLWLFTPAALGRAAERAGFAHFQTRTTAAHAQFLAEASWNIQRHGQHRIGNRPSGLLRCQTLWFQFVAEIAWRHDRHCGEECVLEATR